MAREDERKMILSVGASRALKYKQQHPRAEDAEIIQHVLSNAEEYLAHMDEE